MYFLNCRQKPIAFAISLATLIIPAISYAEQPSSDKQANTEKKHLGKIQVSDMSQQDEHGYDNIYDKNISNIYIGKEMIERFKGASPADLFQSTPGVYSGEARNGAAIDPNIRGIQGQGRIPLTVDGTEQSITVTRGYNGANNRNYLDPNLISSIEIEKGPSLSRHIKSSIGGGITIKTININDILPANENFGFAVKLEGSNNAIKPQLKNLPLGEDYRNLPGGMKSYAFLFDDPLINIHPHHYHDRKLGGLDDYAYRVAIGLRQEKFDLLLASSYRNKGNYFAGTRGANRYRYSLTNEKKKEFTNPRIIIDPYMPFVANIYHPGKEVPNTSNMMKSLLLKNNWHLADDLTVNFTYRDSRLEFGDIMPSRLGFVDVEHNLVPQWPLAQVHQKAGSASLKYQPLDSRWFDFYLSAWFNHTDANTNSAGGYPRAPKDRDADWDTNTFYKFGTAIKNPTIDGSLINSANNSNENNRWGLDINNIFTLTPNLNLTLNGRFQNEKLINHTEYTGVRVSYFQYPGKEGRRQEYQLGFKFDWQPVEFLTFSAGANYVTYWSIDDLVNRKRTEKISGYQKSGYLAGYNVPFFQSVNQQDYDNDAYADDWKKRIKKLAANKHHIYKTEIARLTEALADNKNQLNEQQKIALTNNIDKLKKQRIELTLATRKQYTQQDEYLIQIGTNKQVQKPDINGTNYRPKSITLLYNPNDGKLHKKDNPFFNGKINIDEETIDAKTGKTVKRYYSDQITDGDKILVARPEDTLWQKEKKRKDHGIAPVLSAGISITDDLSVYLRYAESVRMPSLYEDGVGFSDERRIVMGEKTKPERAKTQEFGIHYNLANLLKTEKHADIKLIYFDTTIENVFDRDMAYNFTQMDRQLLSGIEIQARYDNDFIFSDISYVYNIKNKVCDLNTSHYLDPYNQHNIPECIDGGFPGGFLRTAIQPKYSLNMNLGARLWDKKIKIGSRFTYHSKAENRDEKHLMIIKPNSYLGTNNNPMRWDPIFTIDAYVDYKINDNMSVELTGTNLTDEYYLDPLTRSMMPAPGRTFKLSFNSKF
ncbi:TonB-dependent receptor domain-containing protein [Arsenophonus apicola]|uniref:TonB-dependent receptor domain-containing protein n=1 Tax=Arsenophonus apicola TaxID=2879119 RepID=UPI003879F5DD